ncbi:MAG: VCBS repeat-containing protein [Phycisphaerales bacterium]|nr:VCBS repeat-containing protein [Phycisphaerales bacterium]
MMRARRVAPWAIVALFVLSCSKSTPSNTPSAADPDRDPVAVELVGRGVGLMGQFEFEKAREAFAEARRLHPEWSRAAINEAIATLNQTEEGKQERALTILDEVLAKHPDDLQANYCAGLIELFLGRPDRALPRFRLVAQADPSDAYAAYYLGQCREYAGDYASAETSYRAAATADPYLRSAQLGLHRVLQRLDRPDEAEQCLDTFRRLADNPRAALAEFKYTRMGQLGEARVAGAADGNAPPVVAPEGPLFGAAMPLCDLPSGWSWHTFSEDEQASVTVVDLVGDGTLDVFIPGALERGGERRNLVAMVTESGAFRADVDHPLAKVGAVRAALFGDVDNDGLSDVYLCRRGANRLFRQTAPGMWADITEAAKVEGSGGDTADGVLADLDHDGDLDIYAVNADGPNDYLSNNLDGTFRSIAAEAGLAGPAGGSRMALATDLDGDRDLDLLILAREGRNEVHLNDRLWSYRDDPDLDAFCTLHGSAMAVGDLTGDGTTSIVVAADSKAPGAAAEVHRFDRTASRDGSAWNEHAILALPSRPHALAIADLDGDGANELIPFLSAIGAPGDPIVLADRKPLDVAGRALALLDPRRGPALVAISRTDGPIAIPAGAGRHDFAAVRFRGRIDPGQSMRSNADGIGTHFQARVRNRWIGGAMLRTGGGPGQSLQPAAIGLGGAPQIDFVTIDWPDGVFQGEGAIPPGGPTTIVETQRQISSCPVLFAWDGERYRFVSDLLGVGGLGYLLEPGLYATPRPWERFALPEGLAAPRDDRYVLKLTEPMEEACYLDHAALTAWDLPPGWMLTLDERASIEGPEPTGAEVLYRTLLLPTAAHDGNGADQLDAIRAVDGRAAETGRVDPRFIGRLAGELALTIEFDRPLDPDAGSRPVLVIDGWIEYPYCQTNFAAWQAGAAYDPPTVEAQDADGAWHPVLVHFGYPAGMPRQMSVPLEGLPRGTRTLRLRSNMEIYWDRIAVALAETEPTARSTVLPLVAASVAEVGFPARTTHPQRRPWYDYDRRVPLWDVRHQVGEYTAFGNALPLVATADDAVAIFGPGEEVQLEFDTAALPVLPAGWTRRLVLDVRGWCKDMDLFTGQGETIAPLPETGKPAGPRDALHKRFNTRWDGGR